MLPRYLLSATVALVFLSIQRLPAEEPWINLMADKLDDFKAPYGDWQAVGEVTLDPVNPRKLLGKPAPGKSRAGAWYNGPKGRTSNLYTKQKFGDLEVSLEFMMSKGSNSGIKFHGHYEIQICDSFGKKELTGDDCGGIYPRAALTPRYTHLDKGIAPKVNACKPPGEWQTLEAIFQAPRFDKEGKKIANAKIVRATLNGQLIHENQELLTPTGDRWRNPEMAEGPLMIQADHGPVALRHVKIRVPARP
jgi:3-keto-disaccharide hydrolase